MEMKPVESSNIMAIGYDEGSKILYVQFKGGGGYQYKDVPPELYEQFMRAPSKGKFFATYVKKSFAYQRAELPKLKVAEKGQRVELSFDAVLGKSITFELNAEDSKRLVGYLKEGLECLVLYPDYEDKGK